MMNQERNCLKQENAFPLFILEEVLPQQNIVYTWRSTTAAKHWTKARGQNKRMISLSIAILLKRKVNPSQTWNTRWAAILCYMTYRPVILDIF